MSVSCSSENEADYLTALLGSSPCKIIVTSYVVTTSTSTHVLEHIAIPSFKLNDPIHKILAKLSKRCHAAAIKDDTDTVIALEAEIDQLAASVWGITKDELKAIQYALEETKGSSRSQNQKADDKSEE